MMGDNLNFGLASNNKSMIYKGLAVPTKDEHWRDDRPLASYAGKESKLGVPVRTDWYFLV